MSSTERPRISAKRPVAVLSELVRGIEDMRRRQVIDETADDKWLETILDLANATISADADSRIAARCDSCGLKTVGDSLTEWCPNCTSKEDVLRRSLWALELQITNLINDSVGVRLNPDVDAGLYADKGGFLKWGDALRSCWLSARDTAREALKVCGKPEGMP